MMHEIWKHRFPLFGMGSREEEYVKPLDGMIELLKEWKLSYEDNTDRVLAKIDEMRDCFDK